MSGLSPLGAPELTLLVAANSWTPARVTVASHTSGFARRANIIQGDALYVSTRLRRNNSFGRLLDAPLIDSGRPASNKGAYRDRHERWCGMRWTRWQRKTSATDADGEVVWSWRPDAGVKLATMLCIVVGDGDNKARSPGRAPKETVKTIAQGRPGRFRRPVVYLLVCFLLLHTRLRVRLSIRLSPAPSIRRVFIRASGAIASRDRVLLCRAL